MWASISQYTYIYTRSYTHKYVVYNILPVNRFVKEVEDVNDDDAAGLCTNSSTPSLEVGSSSSRSHMTISCLLFRHTSCLDGIARYGNRNWTIFANMDTTPLKEAKHAIGLQIHVSV